MLTEFITLSLMSALWVAAWLHWIFVGHIRQFLFSQVFPETWRGGLGKSTVQLMTRADIEVFLAAQSGAPDFVNGVFSCPGCASAHLSVVGTFLAWCAVIAPRLISGSPIDVLAALILLPLAWAAGAWTGHRLHSKF